ncbi:MAG: zinc-binding dehydrogenase, partial [Bacteroidetes bacterium]|nr:zinc-binding dehydrogenase [Bacteroidota bacterium]
MRSDTMTACVVQEYGAADVLAITRRPRPVPGDDEVLIGVRAAALNPVDVQLRKGQFRLFTRFSPPFVLGSDVAGTVVAVGESVSGFIPGDAVYGMLPTTQAGGYAEYAVLRTDQLAPMPAGCSFEEAAAVPLAALTVIQALRDLAGLQAGQTVLINGASGGVGTVALQIAKAYGAHVTGVCSFRNVELCTRLGADHVIDYTKTDVRALDERFDVVFDVHGTLPFPRARRLLHRGGVHVTTIPSPQNYLQQARTLLSRTRSKVVVVQPSATDLEGLRLM